MSVEHSRISIIREQVQGFLPPTGVREPSNCVHTDDYGVGRAIDQLGQIEVKSSKLRAGIVVGNGAVLSMLPEIPADFVLTIDSNAYVPEWNLYTADVLAEAFGPQAYEQSVYSPANPLYCEYNDQGNRGGKLEGWLKVEHQFRVGRNHFLHPERFPYCQQAAREKPLLPTFLDLTDEGSLQILAGILEGQEAEVTFANLTSVWEWAHQGWFGSLEGLRVLPWHPRAAILYSSTYLNRHNSPVVVEICRGIEEYFQGAKAHDWPPVEIVDGEQKINWLVL